MIVTRERTLKELRVVLGDSYVEHSGRAIPELLKDAAVAIFLDTDNAHRFSDCAYVCRFLLHKLSESGVLEFET